MDDNEIREQLRSDLDRVNYWIGNADQKAGIILAVLGIVIPIVGSTDKVIDIIKVALKPIIEAFRAQDCLPLLNIMYVLLMVVSTIYLALSIKYLLKAIDARIDPLVFKEEGLKTDSLLHFQTISKRFFRTFSNNRSRQMKDIESEMVDYQSQVYINSNICTNKFNDYKQGLHYLRSFLCWFMTTCIVLLCNYIAVGDLK